MDRSTRAFRDGLRRELPRWRDEGLVSDEAEATLLARYHLREAEAGAPGVLPVYLLGALLVGGGVVSLVAWHWDGMSDAARLAVILGAMVACHAAGWTLWRGTGRAPRLGHAITVLGTLVFAANVGLVAQIFHVSGVWWGGFGAAALGALAAGLLYGSLPHLLLAATLGLGVAGPGIAHDHLARGVTLGYGAAALLLALAFRERSRALGVVTVLGLAVTLAAAGAAPERSAAPVLAALAAALAAAPLAAARLTSRDDRAARLAGALRPMGRLLFYAVAYLLSFQDLARELRFRGTVPEAVLAAGLPALALAAAALAAGLRRREVDPLARGEAMLVAGTAIAFALGLSLEHGTGTALVANLGLVFLAAGRVVRGLSSLARAPFWEGLALAGLVLVSRFLELDTELWLKGAGFIACGVGVLAAGFAFERRRARGAEVGHAV